MQIKTINLSQLLITMLVLLAIMNRSNSGFGASTAVPAREGAMIIMIHPSSRCCFKLSGQWHYCLVELTPTLVGVQVVQALQFPALSDQDWQCCKGHGQKKQESCTCEKVPEGTVINLITHAHYIVSRHYSVMLVLPRRFLVVKSLEPLENVAHQIYSLG